MAGNLIESAKGVVDNAIQAAKNLLGISSPSKVFMELGEESGRGLELGLKSMASKVAEAGEKMAGAAVPDSLSQNFELQNPGAAQPLVQHLNFERMFDGANFHVREESDINKIARELHRMTRTAARGQGIR